MMMIKNDNASGMKGLRIGRFCKTFHFFLTFVILIHSHVPVPVFLKQLTHKTLVKTGMGTRECVNVHQVRCRMRTLLRIRLFAYHPPVLDPHNCYNPPASAINFALARIACIEPLAFRKKVWFSGRTIRDPVPIRWSGLNYEYVNNLLRSLRRTMLFYRPPASS